MPADQPDLDRVDELYCALTTLEEGSLTRAPALSFGNLVTLLTRGGKLTSEQQRALFQDRRLRADFQRLKEEFAAALPPRDEAGSEVRSFIVPAIAAAATNTEVDERVFEGGRISIVPSRAPGQVYIKFMLDRAETRPGAFQIERLDPIAGRLETAVVELDSPDENNLIQMQIDSQDPVVRLLRAPDASGQFLNPVDISTASRE